MKQKLKIYLELFLTFAKIGLFTFGGGYAMIPLIQKEAGERRHWITEEELLEIVAIAESTPGPIAINAATFIGSRRGGFFGALSATLGMVTPSFAIILLLSFLLKEFQAFKPVAYAFRGIRAGVLALILKALWSMWKQAPKKAFSCVVMAAAFVCVALLKINVVFVIVGCAAAGLLFSLLAERRRTA